MNLENKKQFATILLAIGLGLVATFLMSQYIQESVQKQTTELATNYQKQTSAMVNELQAMKSDFDRLQANQQELAKRQMEAPKTVAAPVRDTRGDAGVFSVRTPPGKRAMTIDIDPLAAVGGLINPGDFVDIIAELDVPSAVNDRGRKGEKVEMQKVTTVLFQNVQVLAVDANFGPIDAIKDYLTNQKSKSLKVTLALSPEESGLLTFAQSNGKLKMALRSPEEADMEDVQVASWDTLSDFLAEQQGTELIVPKAEASIRTTSDGDVKPYVQIFKGGQEL